MSRGRLKAVKTARAFLSVPLAPENKVKAPLNNCSLPQRVKKCVKFEASSADNIHYIAKGLNNELCHFSPALRVLQIDD